ncbi:TATA-binding protein-associated factor mot1 [Blastocladiella emersonii ATCC 22665]|nr:TATA-binding protein-associated factor mot1 [Blastocladiella emersonii ATCC 22665]
MDSAAAPPAPAAGAAKAGATRLDRLFQLLDAPASTPAIRAAAANQIADLAAGPDGALPGIVRRLLPLFRSKLWTSRSAAAQALELIARKTLSSWDPAAPLDPLPDPVPDAHALAAHSAAWATADLAALLDVAATMALPRLLATRDNVPNLSGVDLHHAAVQRAAILRNLGISPDLVDGSFAPAPPADPAPALAPTPVAATPAKSARGRARGAAAARDLPNTPSSSTSSPALAPAATTATPPPPQHVPTPADDPAAIEAALADHALSAREKNALKRKLKQLKRTASDASISAARATPPPPAAAPAPAAAAPPARPVKRARIQSSSSLAPSSDLAAVSSDVVMSEADSGPAEPVIIAYRGGAPAPTAPATEQPDAEPATPVPCWPFQALCDLLCHDLADPTWEVRHGAAIGIRELIKVQGHLAGRVGAALVDTAINDNLNRRYLHHVARTLIVVLARDRFSDFINDTVTVPVRESCAQALGVIAKHLSLDDLEALHKQLVALSDFAMQSGLAVPHKNPKADRSVWALMLSALLGIKYLLAVRQDAHDRLFLKSFATIGFGLQNTDDDVRAVASAAMLPLVGTLVEKASFGELSLLLQFLKKCLDSCDDLSASTSSVMDLLAALSESPRVARILIPLLKPVPGASTGDVSPPEPPKPPLLGLPPLLYKFFRHPLACVRVAVVRMFKAFMAIEAVTEPRQETWWIRHEPLRHVFQNFLFEEADPAVIDVTSDLWRAMVDYLAVHGALPPIFAPLFQAMLQLAFTPIGTALDCDLLLFAPHDEAAAASRRPQPRPAADAVASKPAAATGRGRGRARGRGGSRGGSSVPVSPALSHGSVAGNGFDEAYDAKGMSKLDPAEFSYDRAMIKQDLAVLSPRAILHGRLVACKALGYALAKWPPAPALAPETALSELTEYLDTDWAFQRQLAALVLQEYAVARRAVSATPESEDPASVFPQFAAVIAKLHAVLAGSHPPTAGRFLELGPSHNRVYAECLRTARRENVALPALDQFHVAVHAAHLAAADADVASAVDAYSALAAQLETRVASSIAAALVALAALPTKLNPVVRSLMAAVQTEPNQEIQECTARAVALLARLCRGKPVVDKVVGNLAVLLCSDPQRTPLVVAYANDSAVPGGILTLVKQDEAAAAAEASATAGEGRGRRSANSSSGPAAPAPSSDAVVVAAAAVAGQDVHAVPSTPGQITHRGAAMTISALAVEFGTELFDAVPKLAELVQIAEFAAAVKATAGSPEAVQALIDALQLVASLAPVVARHAVGSSVTLIADQLIPIVALLDSPAPVVRYMAALAIAAVVAAAPVTAMPVVVEYVVPRLSTAGSPDAVHARRGAAETLHHVVTALDHGVLPYAIFLVVPLMGAMSDFDDAVRRVVSSSFATLLKLIPLEEAIPDPPGFPAHLVAQRAAERAFLGQLLGTTPIEPYTVPVALRADLRAYQRDGVAWMMFLNRYKLHGILCDDMGLGKTLQTIAVLSSHHHHVNGGLSLVVCPSTLTGHWVHEIHRYSPNLSAMCYTGSVAERRKLAAQVAAGLAPRTVVVTSYEVLRNDVDVFRGVAWEYCVLDEGHVIRNAKTKATRACKAVRARHRLVLTGTPIQNNVLELWSLFDFLMPGFLGTEAQFSERFSRPILASRDAKKSSAEQERGVRALRDLHRQVLPFTLRRLKEDVLDDLPPKIIQDYYCDLSPLQASMYRDVVEGSSSAASTGSGAATDGDADGSKKKHVFQVLQTMRKIANHPVLHLRGAGAGAVAAGGSGPAMSQATRALMPADPRALHDLEQAPKLAALRQLLNDCGIGVRAPADATAAEGGAAPGHRVLVFAQMKLMLDLIERDLFAAHMPGVSYLRLDGSTDQRHRHSLVQQFNDDPSIDVLLLTTQAGGLGLNLTGADTVIFVEHDWNPMKDLQAMDRAHRLGQKRVVSVYRLIARGTLEEKIMGLQRFKLHIAGQVVNQQNAGLETMDTDQLLDLFSVDEVVGSSSAGAAGAGGKEEVAATAAAVLQDLDDLAAQQYEDEYNMDGYLASL